MGLDAGKVTRNGTIMPSRVFVPAEIWKSQIRGLVNYGFGGLIISDQQKLDVF